MPISVPPYMPIAQRHRPNIDIAESIGGLGDALIGGLEYGQQRKVDKATRAAFQEPVYNPDGTMNFGAMAGKIAQGGGDIDTAMALTRLAETQVQNQYLRGKPSYFNTDAGLVGVQPGAQGQPARVDTLVPSQPDKPDTPSGYEPTEDGAGLRPIPGGPADPAVVERTAGARRQARPLSVYEQKTIKESEDRANAGENTISMLNEALLLSPKALSGIGAQQRGYAGSNLPEGAPGRAASVATEKLNNLVTRQALEQLRTIFAANPTEGERAILLEIQGSVNQATDVREDIYRRAIKLAQKRVAEDRTTAQAIRNREYFSGDEGGAVPGSTENAGAASALPPGWTQEEWDVLTPEEQQSISQ